ncbi:MAG: hypothetical protein HYU39_06955 [Thaumarchaeota archaeon]|nr:hypothetical protein [Nitrososphaerota archaeon]
MTKFEKWFLGQRVVVDTIGSCVSLKILKPLHRRDRGLWVGVNKQILDYAQASGYYIVAEVLLTRKFYSYKAPPTRFLEKGELTVKNGIPTIYMLPISLMEPIIDHSTEKQVLGMIYT